MPLRFSRLALILSVVALPFAVGASEVFVTAKGKTVAMPDVSAMNCAQIEATLAAIDATRYRENAPVNPDPADDILFAYEQKLAHALFEACALRPKAVPETGATIPQEQASNR